MRRSIRNGRRSSEGFEAAGGRVESEILPARLAGPTTSEPGSTPHCLAGRVSWTRLTPARSARCEANAGSGAGAHDADHAPDAAPSCAGAWAAIARAARRAKSQPRVIRRSTCSSSSAGTALRSSTSSSKAAGSCARRSRTRSPSSSRAGSSRRTASPACAPCSCRRASASLSAADGAGAAPRRSAWTTPAAGRLRAAARPPTSRRQGDREAIDHLARTLLRRYGVVFWRLIEREADWLPPWRDLLRVFRRRRSRGDIRGGRFVAGFGGEQFALPDAVGSVARDAPQATERRMACSSRSPAPIRSISSAS